MNNEWFSVNEAAGIEGVTPRAIRKGISKNKYITRKVKTPTGFKYEIMPESLGYKAQNLIDFEKSKNEIEKNREPGLQKTNTVPTHAKQIALARYDLVNLWVDYRKISEKKTEAGQEFLNAYNGGKMYPVLFNVLGKVSIGTIYRWHKKIKIKNDYTLLIPNYDYGEKEGAATLAKEEEIVFKSLLLAPNKINIGKATTLTKDILAKRGYKPDFFQYFMYNQDMSNKVVDSRKGKNKKVLSLFSGCGGMDLGFEGRFKVPSACVNKDIHPDWVKDESNNFIELQPTDFDLVFANDIMDIAKTAWNSYFKKYGYPDNIFHLESIVDLVKAYKKGEYSFPENVDIVTGGFPCQDFSVAGKRRGFNSEKSHNGRKEEFDVPTTETRGMLYLWMKEVIEITKPKVFIAENVKGLVSFGDVKEIIENDFRDIDEGYLVVPARVLFAGDYGVPQKRERVIFIGLNKKYLKKDALKALTQEHISEEYDPYPIKTHYDDSKATAQLSLLNNNDKLKPYVKTSEVVKDLKEPAEEIKDLAQMCYSKAKYCPNSQGQTEINLNGLAPTIRAEHHGNIEYRRLSKDNGGTHLSELKQGLEERRLTVRECARFQTFPDDYPFVQAAEKAGRYKLSASSAYKLIGNAVPPLLAYNIAKRLEELWDKLFI